jgi:hypothetical protein
VQVYDTHDPLLWLANLTQGSMVLANKNVNEVALGIVTLIFGAVLCMPLVMLQCMRCIQKVTQQQSPLLTGSSLDMHLVELAESPLDISSQ